MNRLLAVAVACLALAACTTTNTKLATLGDAKPPASSRVLVLTPDISLGLLTAGGLTEPRQDWSEQARKNVSTQIGTVLDAKHHPIKTLDAQDAMAGRTGQLLRLHGAVGASVLLHEYGMYKLPTKKDKFEWTLGEGAQELRKTYDCDYALFVHGEGSYASAGRVVVSLIAGVPMGQQRAFASLVDLRTGQVIWFNFAVAATGADMRETAGSESLVKSLLKDLPL